MKIQEQTWSDFKRFLILADEGSVMLEFYDPPTSDGTTAYIGSLWVNEEHRRKGIATALMDKAEELARSNKHKQVTLFWARTTPTEILEWYRRRGYAPYKRDCKNIYLRKILTK